MNWLDYCTKHLVLINTIMIDAQTALRKQKNTPMYKACCDIINESYSIQESKIYYNFVSKKEILKLFGKTFLWCHCFQNEIKDLQVRHKIQLLALQTKKQTKKTFQRYASIMNYKSNTKYSIYDYDDWYEDDCICLLFNNNVFCIFMGMF